jgi:hypothetical protein
MQKNPETDANIAPLTCKRPGCENKLSAANVIGLCRGHVRWTGERASNAGNGHAAASSSGVNGSAPKANGHAHAPGNGVTAKTNGHAAAAVAGFLEERVDRLLLNLPADDKFRICQQWLSGAI